MIYTSYFAKLKSLPDSVIPVSICAKAPNWYTGLEYKRLAPSYQILSDWKKYHNEINYIANFSNQILKSLNPVEVITDLLKITQTFNIEEKDICLICYEKPSDFCHRHLVADWLNKNGFHCEEYKF